MSAAIPKRVTSTIEGDFVVFPIGMRINAWWKTHRWLPVMLSMRRKLRELDQGRSRGDVGIWHETYGVRAGEYECVYSGMPEMGLALASRMVDAAGELDTAQGRMGRGEPIPSRERSARSAYVPISSSAKVTQKETCPWRTSAATSAPVSATP